MCVLGYKTTVFDVSSDPNNPSAVNEPKQPPPAQGSGGFGVGVGKGKGPITVNDLEFRVSVDELRELMELKSQEAKEKLDQVHQGTEGLAHKLKVDVQQGLTGASEDLKKRVELYGKNEIPPKRPKPIIVLALEATKDTTLIMLIICAIVSIGLSFYHPPSDGENTAVNSNLEWIEGVAILVAVIVVVSVTAFNDWRKERQFRGLKARIEKDHLASVVRNAEIIQINVKELVVGEICCIKYGDLVPADGIIVQASDLKIDESSLTGETDLIKKTATENMLVLSGTQVMEGSGRFLVTGVGLNSQTGIIMTLLGATNVKKPKTKKKKTATDVEEGVESGRKGIWLKLKKFKEYRKKRAKNKKQQSVLQKKLGKLALQIGYAGMTAAGFTFIILCLRLAINEFAIQKKPWSNIYIKYFISFLIQAITVIVVAVPEGLPLAVTLALAFAVRKMTKDNNLVRHLDACETMGNATTICSDKTGTLTTNRMTVVQCWLGDEYFKKVPAKDTVNDRIKDLVFNSIAINSNYTSMNEPSTQPGDLPKQIGNKTECGLLGLVTDLGGDYGKIRAQFPNDQFTKCYTFNSARKMMSTIVKIEEGHYRVYSKGASEMVLSKCKYFLDKSGNVAPMSKDKCDSVIRDVVEAMASEALRTICVAYRDFKSKASESNGTKSEVYYYDSEPDWEDEPDIVADMVCICLTGIEDPVRDEVPDAIKKCQTSGVVVRMVTGDNIATATSIALKCGIISPSDDFLILESKEFNKRIRDSSGNVNQDLLDKVWPRLRVLARSSPQDKYILVNGIVESKISANREVVAVTGDGTNDGPALKRADVGFAMGIQGTDVAKEASDIILTDDNFSSIVKAMMWGRNVYDSIAKFLQFQLTANVTAAVLCVICAATIQSVPIKAIQMLWVNLVMDTLASLALATEPPTEDLLKRAPYGRTKSLISITILKNIIGHAVYQLAILFGLIWGIESWMNIENVTKYDDINKLTEPSEHFTVIFNAFVLMTLFNEINARKIHNERNVLKGIFRNFIFIAIWLFCLVAQIIIVCFGGIVFSVKPIGWRPWLWCIAFGVGSLIWAQVLITIPDKWVKKVIKALCCGCTSIKRRLEARKSKRQLKKKAAHVMAEEEEAEAKKMANTRWVRGSIRINSQLKVVEEYKTDGIGEEAVE